MKPRAILRKLYKNEDFLFALCTRIVRKHKDPYNRAMFNYVPFSLWRSKLPAQAMALVEKIRKSNTCYSWYTIAHRNTYYAIGPSIEKQVVELFDMTGTDAVKFFEKGAIVTCSTFKPNLKGGHRQNAWYNANFRKTYRSKQARKIAQCAFKYEKSDGSARAKLLKCLTDKDKLHFYDAKVSSIARVAKYADI